MIGGTRFEERLGRESREKVRSTGVGGCASFVRPRRVHARLNDVRGGLRMALDMRSDCLETPAVARKRGGMDRVRAGLVEPGRGFLPALRRHWEVSRRVNKRWRGC